MKSLDDLFNEVEAEKKAKEPLPAPLTPEELAELERRMEEFQKQLDAALDEPEEDQDDEDDDE